VAGHLQVHHGHGLLRDALPGCGRAEPRRDASGCPEPIRGGSDSGGSPEHPRPQQRKPDGFDDFVLRDEAGEGKGSGGLLLRAKVEQCRGHPRWEPDPGMWRNVIRNAQLIRAIEVRGG